MAEENLDQSPVPLSPPPPQPGGFYESPRKAYERVGGEFDYWTGKLTDTSLQMCYALIGPNWVVFGSVGNILKSHWSELSLLMVMLTLGCNLLGSWIISALHKKVLDRADKRPVEWEAAYEAAASGRDPDWPFTRKLIRLGSAMRFLKGLLPLAGAVLLIIGAIVSSSSIVAKPALVALPSSACFRQYVSHFTASGLYTGGTLPTCDDQHTCFLERRG